MSDKGKHHHPEPVGQLGKIFTFTRDDLAANRAGFMTLPQQFAFTFSERRWMGWLLRIPPVKWIKPQAVRKITGKIKKHYGVRVVYTGSGGSGGGHQEVLEQRSIEVHTADSVTTFFVREQAYNALPEKIEITLYYDPQENRIVSIEPPYEV